MPLVDFGAVEDKKIIEIADEDIPEWVIEPVKQVTEPEPEPEFDPEPEPEYEPEPEPAPIYEPEPAPIYEPESEPVIEPQSMKNNAPEFLSEPEQEESEYDDEETKLEEEYKQDEPAAPVSKGRKWLMALLACLLGLIGGYILGNFFPWVKSAQPQDVKVEKATPATRPAAEIEPVDSIEPIEPVESAPAEAPAEKPVESKQVEKKPVESKPIEPKSVVKLSEPKSAPASKPAEPAVQHDKYAQMDNRVKYGAYRIVGTAQVVKVKAGDNLKKIARRILGPDMECYLEVYNGMNSKTELKEGQSIKIPKLELKKKKSKKNI